MYNPENLGVDPFILETSVINDLFEQNKSYQSKYLYDYLQDLKAKTIIVEPHYFDKNYLAEFAVFYSKSAYGYLNKCRRIHFFSKEFDKEDFLKFLSEEETKNDPISKNYLGFIVVRPFNHAPFGTTVLKKYLDRDNTYHRILTERKYTTHIAGKSLEVEGLAWQQQDTAVGACATVALWTALNSSAFDDHHAIPTTAKITLLANKTAPWGNRTFPSHGLNYFQMCEAIKENDFSPLLISGDIRIKDKMMFTKEKFSSSLYPFIRSGYSVIAIGSLNNTGHAICITGFREASCTEKLENGIGFADIGVDTIYAHDDNLGPNVRFKVKESDDNSIISLSPQAPPPYAQRKSDNTSHYPNFIPTMFLIAVHNDMAISPDYLNEKALKIIEKISASIELKINLTKSHLTSGFMIIKGTHYLDEKLRESISDKTTLGKIRLEIWEKVRPMSLYIGVIRIGINTTTIMDVLFDTTGIPEKLSPIASLIYSSSMISVMETIEDMDFGIRIEAWNN